MDKFRDIITKLIELKGKFDPEVQINNQTLNVVISNSIFPTLGVREDVDEVLDKAVSILGAILMKKEDKLIKDMVEDGHDLDEAKEKLELVRDLLITDDLMKNFMFQKWCTGLIFYDLQSEILYKQVGNKELVKYAQIRLQFENNQNPDEDMESLVFEANEDSLTYLIDQLIDIRESMQEKVDFNEIKVS